MSKLLEYVRTKHAEILCEVDEATIFHLEREFLASAAQSDKPELLAFAGGSGSGKTTYQTKFGKKEGYFLHDMDVVMVRMPGYIAEPDLVKAFEKTWRVAQKLSDIMVNFALDSRMNIIFDRTCGAESSFITLQRARSLGYNMIMFGLYIEEDIALARVAERSKALGRTVTEAMTIEYRARFSALWPSYLQIFDEATLLYSREDYPVIFTTSETQRAQIDQSHAGRVFAQIKYAEFLAPGKAINFAEMFPNIPADKNFAQQARA